MKIILFISFFNLTHCFVQNIKNHLFQPKLNIKMNNDFYGSPWSYNELIENTNMNYNWESLVEPVRGCPYTCTFCEIGDRFYTKSIKQDKSKLFKEIDWVSKHKIEYLHLVDNNFGMIKEHKEVSDYLFL